MELSEDEEFGMVSYDSDPVEVDYETALKDHPDFTFLSSDTIRELISMKEDDAACPIWLKHLPIENDPLRWTFVQVLIRPDRSWNIIKDLIATICFGHGLMLSEENTTSSTSLLFRKHVGQDSVAHGIVDVATYQNLYVHVGVLPSKLRALHLGYVVSYEQTLMGGALSTHFQGLPTDRLKALNRSLDNLVAVLQSTITSQLLSATYLYMTTSENTTVTGSEKDAVKLDEGYVNDVRDMFVREMKGNMRELCIPLEEYAHNQEYSCALMLGLLDPLLKKYGLEISTNIDSLEKTEDAVVSNEASSCEQRQPTLTDITQEPPASEKIYGELITDMVHQLWTSLKQECDEKVQTKINEKRKQVTTRAQAAQKLRVRALQAIINYPDADTSSLKRSTRGNRDDALLYEGSCVINNMPVKLHVTYGYIIFRTMVPLFAKTIVVPFVDVVEVVESTTLGIRVLRVNYGPSAHLTIAMGMEVELLYQLLLEVVEMHRQERYAPQDRASLEQGTDKQGTECDDDENDIEEEVPLHHPA